VKEINDDFKILAEIAGPKITLKIVESFAGSMIYIPKNILTARKHLEVLEGYKSGKSYRELSLLSGYSESYVRKIISKKNHADIYQLDLFQSDFDNSSSQIEGDHKESEQ
jgi:Mor family transcriptional regulator